MQQLAQVTWKMPYPPPSILIVTQNSSYTYLLTGIDFALSIPEGGSKIYEMSVNEKGEWGKENQVILYTQDLFVRFSAYGKKQILRIFEQGKIFHHLKDMKIRGQESLLSQSAIILPYLQTVKSDERCQIL